MCRGFESLLRYQNPPFHVARIFGISRRSILRALGCGPMFPGLFQALQIRFQDTVPVDQGLYLEKAVSEKASSEGAWGRVTRGNTYEPCLDN